MNIIRRIEKIERRLRQVDSFIEGVDGRLQYHLEQIIELQKKFNSLKNRDKEAEQGNLETITLDMVLPEADISGLHFNEQKVKAVFDFQDGMYYSRDILFHSARDTDEGTGEDILMAYLNTIEFKQAIYKAFYLNYSAEPLFTMGLKRVPDIKITLPEKSRGVKRYNGACSWYWLLPSYSGSATRFCIVNSSGAAGFTGASAATHAYGVAPAFCVGEN
jgi:hypothetical protein